MNRLTALLCLPAFLAVTGWSAEPAISSGFEHFYNLEYVQAIQDFREETVKEPGNPDSWNHLAQGILYSEMYKAGALESEMVSGSNPFIRREKMNPSPEAAREFDSAVAKSLELTGAELAKNPRNVKALYTSGVTYGLRANYNYLVRKAWMDALKDATNARKAHNLVIEIDPNFTDARLIQGLHDYIVGSLPWHIRMFGFLAGFHGDREAGLRTLKLVAEKGNVNRYDAQVLLAAIYRRERRPLDAIPLLKGVSERFPRNFLFRLEMVQMYSDAGDKTAALDILDKLEARKKAGESSMNGLPWEKLWYYRGNLLFWYRDYDAAIAALSRVTPNTHALDLHAATLAWVRLGQCYDMKGNRPAAQNAYREALKTGPQTDVAKDARNYLSSAYKRPANV